MANVSIYGLQHVGQQPELPAETEARRLTLAGLGQQQQLNEQRMQLGAEALATERLAREQRQRDVAEAQAAQEILRRHQRDPAKALPELWSAAPKMAAAVSDHITKREKELRDAEAQRLTMQGQRDAITGEAIATVLGQTDPAKRAAVYKVQRARLAGTGLFKPEELPEEMPDEATLTGYASQIALNRAADEKRKAAAETRAQAEYEATIGGKRVNEQGLTPAQVQQAGRPLATEFVTDDAGNVTAVQVMPGGQPPTAQRIPGVRGKTKAAEGAGQEATGPLTPEAIELAAHQWAMTGAMPPLGMGKAGAGMRAKIMNRAAELYPQIDLASNKAAYGANVSSLRDLQKRQDFLESFEKTAGRNLDQFLSTAKGVVESGSPLLNRPLRLINEKVLGATEQTAFSTARQVAVQEIAKVLNNPQSQGAVSEGARKEIENLIRPDATLKQIYAASKILKTDMDNRRISGQEQIKEIQQRIGAGRNRGGDGGESGGPVQKWGRDKDGKPVRIE
jgi:hypothetical protein